jgi:hypothetical protein
VSNAQMLANLQKLLSRVRTRAAEPRVRGDVADRTPPAVLDGVATPSAAFAPQAQAIAASATAPAVSAPAVPPPAAPAIAARAEVEDADVSEGMSTWTPPAGGLDGIDVDVDVEIEVSESLPPEADESLPPEADESLAASPVAAPEEAPARTESESEERLRAAQPVSPEPAREYAAADAERTPSTPPDVVQAASPGLAPEPAAASGVALAHAGAPAEPAPVDALPNDSWTPPAAASPPPVQPAPQTVPELEMDRGSGSPAALDDASSLEAAPASSRRPVEPEEQLADMAFGPGAAQPPRHTPPPESGRLPAAPPDEFDDVDVTGVRNATALAKGDTAEPLAPRAEPIVAEASRPVLSATGDVADVVGPSPRFVPKTFAELLEATLLL